MSRQQSGARAPRTGFLRAGLAAFIVATAPTLVLADHISELKKEVKFGDKVLGEIRLHVGTSDFTATGNEGIGKAEPTSEQSGFYTPDGMNLDQMAQMAGEHHFNWLQIVTTQPESHDETFGAVPHPDPSSDPDNPQPRDKHPWYLNESDEGATPDPAINPPFDLPAGTDGLLPFQDFPSGIPEGEMIAFDTYLVSIIDVEKKTYDLHAGFSWKITNEKVGEEATARNHVVELKMIPATLTAEYKKLVHDYEDMGWTFVPEPSTGLLLVVGLAVAATRRRAA